MSVSMNQVPADVPPAGMECEIPLLINVMMEVTDEQAHIIESLQMRLSSVLRPGDCIAEQPLGETKTELGAKIEVLKNRIYQNNRSLLAISNSVEI